MSSPDPNAERMIRDQLIPRGIRDPDVLDAMRRVPRPRFVAPEFRAEAWEDGPLPIGCDQTISQPYVVAFMTSQLPRGRGVRVLEIGTGCGYQTAVLAQLFENVFTIEFVPQLSAMAQCVLDELDIRNVAFRTGDGHAGWPEASPFQAIIGTAAAREVPPKLIEQLAIGGRMILPVGDRQHQELRLIEKTRVDHFTEQAVMPVRFVPMVQPEKS